MIQQLLVAGVILSLTASVFAVVLSAGTAMRVNQRQMATSVPGGLEVGELIPTEELQSVVGGAVDTIVAGPTVIAFATSGCRPCREMVDRLNVLLPTGYAYQFVVVEPASYEVPSLKEMARFEATWVRDPERKLHHAFKSNSTPHVFLVNRGMVLESVRGGSIESMLRTASTLAADQLQRGTLPAGGGAVDFDLTPSRKVNDGVAGLQIFG